MDTGECLFYHILHEGCINKYNPTNKSYVGKCEDEYCPEKHPELKEEKKEQTKQIDDIEVKKNKKKKKKKVMKRKTLI